MSGVRGEGGSLYARVYGEKEGHCMAGGTG